jgi:hypothetical protein
MRGILWLLLKNLLGKMSRGGVETRPYGAPLIIFL